MLTYIYDVPSIERNIRKVFNTIIISDKVNTVNPLRNILESRGHNVSICNQCINCISLCMKHSYDIVFVDCDKDIDINGLAEVLKRLDGNSNIYVFSLEKNFNSNKRLDSMDGIILKPIKKSVLNNLLNHLELGIKLSKNVMHRNRELFL